MNSAVAAYRRLFVTNSRLVVFSFLMALYSSFGQTYFIGVFGPQIQTEFDLTHTLWGSIYLAGTLTSALLMPFTGALIDRFSLSSYALAVGFMLVAACAYISVITGPVMLVVAIFLLRQSGQGLASHVSITSMARYFDRDRGRAIAVASLGYSVGEAVLPFLAVVLIAIIGWRLTYGGAAILVGATLLPATIWLLKNHDRFHRRYLNQLTTNENSKALSTISWTRRQVLRDLRFYVMIPGLLSSPMIVTAFFFYHLNIADAKGWSGAWVTGTYIFYALGGIVTLLLAGPLVDRFQAQRVIQIMLIPLIGACFMLAVVNHALWVIPYMVMMGIHTGLIHTSASALWAELYGPKHLGAIKSLYLALMVFASAVGPAIMGILMDAGLSIYKVCSFFGIYVTACALLIVLALRMKPNMPWHQTA